MDDDRDERDGRDDDRDEPPEVPGHRLLHVIGSGSTSVVWAGTDAAGAPVAVKVPRARPDPVAVREAQIERHVLMAVRHEHLVALRDVVPLSDGRVALVFDLVIGATLASLVASRGHLRPGEVVTVLTPIAEAVAALHAAGGTHCDISPGNVMLTAAGRPLLMDLGAGRLAGAGAGAVVGTAGFVAPEVRSGEQPTEASDVFSLGALAWFCLTGNGAPDTFLRLAGETVASHVGPELGPVVGRCLDPEPEVRPSSAALPALVFDAAAGEPVEVVVGADEASALTHRIRADAALGRPPATETPRPWFRRVPVSPARWSHRLAVLAGIAVLATLLGWFAHLGLVPGTGGTEPASGHGVSEGTGGDGRPPAARVTTTPTHSGSAVAPSPSPAVSGTPAGPLEARAILQDLTDRRVAALTGRKVGSLGAVHRPDSPSWRADSAVIDALTSGHLHYEGLRMTVSVAQFASRSASEAVVRARVAVAAYEVVDDRGRATAREAVEGEPLDFHLVRDGAGWRIESITAPRAS
ncbi:MAG: protein kinase domain-containing protein [Intrasporangium sp.]|uniref:protein kinase domain-containing protein n=1 Tax=Intrasporangium sp. TaxID=1925024 RepID=UPI003F820D3E